MSGYVRQSVADIVTDEVVEALPLNNEFNALEAAFGSSTGHAHDGSVGNGPKINLTDAVTDILPVANGGTGRSTAMSAAELLTEIKTVDGTGSGLDADLVHGNSLQSSATDTTSGALLQVGSFGLGGSIILVTPDLNNDRPTGFYYCNSPTNSPVSSNGWLLQQRLGEDYVTQLYSTISGSVYRRIKNETWGSWIKLYDESNLPTMTASDILTSIKTVDGSGSGLDADLLDGQHGSYYSNAANLTGTFGGAITTSTKANFNAGLSASTVTVGSTAPASDAIIAAPRLGNSFEFGHTNASGYRSVLGAESSSGKSFLAFNAEAGTTANTYRTRGIQGSVIRGNTAGGIDFGKIPTASADNQTFGTLATLDVNGTFTAQNQLKAVGNVYAGSSYLSTTGEINGSTWGGNLSTYLASTYAPLSGAAFTSNITGTTLQFLRNGGGYFSNGFQMQHTTGINDFLVGSTYQGNFYGLTLQYEIDSGGNIKTKIGRYYNSSVVTSLTFTNSEIQASSNLYAVGFLAAGGGSAVLSTTGDVSGSTWGGSLATYLGANYRSNSYLDTNFARIVNVPGIIAGMSTGGLGSYAFLKSGGSYSAGSSYAGSSLFYSNDTGASGNAATGTWLAMGTGAANTATVFLRIA